MVGSEASSWRVYCNTFLLVVAMVFPVFGYYFAKRFGEPYPWLIMPSFSGDRRDSRGDFTAGRVDVVVRFADGSEEIMSLTELFDPMPPATAGAFYSKIILSDSRNTETREQILGTPETSRFYYLKRYLQPGFVSREYNERPAVMRLETQAWLSNRVVSIYQNREPFALDFKRTVTHFDARGVPVDDQRIERIERSIPLHGQ